MTQESTVCAWENDTGRRPEFNLFRAVETEDRYGGMVAEYHGGVLVRQLPDGHGGMDFVGVALDVHVGGHLARHLRINAGGSHQLPNIADGWIGIACR